MRGRVADPLPHSSHLALTSTFALRRFGHFAKTSAMRGDTVGDLVLAIDIGTTAVKSAVFDLRGRKLKATSAPVPILRFTGGLVEQNPQDWFDCIATALAEFKEAGLLAGISAVGITSQVNTHVFVDAHGKSLAPAIVWQDRRAAVEAAELDARITAKERNSWWGAPLGIDSSHALARMAWMARHRPEIWDRTKAVLLPKDFVISSLTGTVQSDPMSNIGLVGQDLTYVRQAIALMPGALERLPPLAPADAVAGQMSVAVDLPKVPVSVGIMDAWAGFYGVGLRSEGEWAYLSGTSDVLASASERVIGEPGVLVFPRHGGLRVHAGPTQSGGASVAWFCATFHLEPDEMASEVQAAGSKLLAPLYLPHQSGERAPLWDAMARGAFLGLESSMDRAAMARGVYEGVALSGRLLMNSLEASSGLRAESLLCGGGGFRSDIWSQIRADVLGRPLRRTAVLDAGLVGAAALGAVAAGLQSDLTAALTDLVTHDRTFEPDLGRTAQYNDLFALYRPAYEALRPISRALASRGS